VISSVSNPADRYPCLEWDSNPRSQCSSERISFVPQIECDTMSCISSRVNSVRCSAVFHRRVLSATSPAAVFSGYTCLALTGVFRSHSSQWICRNSSARYSWDRDNLEMTNGFFIILLYFRRSLNLIRGFYLSRLLISSPLSTVLWELERTRKIWSFHSGDYEEWHLLGCYAVWLLYEPTFRRNLAPPSSGWQESVN
jgi:hypothetical protein